MPTATRSASAVRPTCEESAIAKNKEQHKPFQKSFIKLAGIARERPAVGEDHAPRGISNAAIELSIDEIGESAKEKTDGYAAAGQVCEIEEIKSPLVGIDSGCDDNP